jgi:hypothetical protein
MATISVTVPTVTEYTVTPSRTSPTTFFTDRETRLSEEATRIPEQNTQATALNTFKTQANAVRDEVNGFKTAAETAQGLAETAQAAAELAETGAAESATASSDSADASEVSRLAAEAILDNFDDRYLGAKASDPTLDNDGNALQSGALYYNTTSDEMKVYDLTLTTWISISYVPTTLTSLSDTNLSTPSNGQVLSYDFGTSKWVNTTPTSVTVNNTLTSTSTTEALSANMGKTLKDAQDLKAPAAKFTGIVTAPIVDTATLTNSSYSQATDATLGTGTHTFDFANGDAQELTMAGDITLAFSNFVSGKVCTMIIDAINWGAWTPTYPTGIYFAAKTKPELTAVGRDKLMVIKDKDDVYELYVIGLDVGIEV